MAELATTTVYGDLTVTGEAQIIGDLNATGLTVNGYAVWHANNFNPADKANTTITLTAGDGLSGGGDLTVNRSFAVDTTVIRTTGDQSISGTKTFSGTLNVTGSVTGISAADVGAATDTHNHDSTYVNANTAITGATNTKITYDSKGLVTGGASLVAADIPNLAAAKITSGTMATARLGSGTASSSTYLRGDSTWVTPPNDNTTYSAGNGISLSGTTFSVAGGAGLTQEASGLAVDSTVIRTTGDQSMSGVKTFTEKLIAPAIIENPNTITADYTISTGNNALSAGPITIEDGVTITIPVDSVWTIV